MQSTKNYSLRNINISIRKGECVGIIGSNGSGKSTLLKLICEITAPTEGKISVNGKISSLLELGTGFNPEYTGISNIYLNGTLQGLTRKETKSLLPEIEAFADISDYINKPVKTYSDGMFLRLAFACATAVRPDILIVDEALAVGDFNFRRKCFDKIRSLNNSGTTILFVSHDIDTVRCLCSRTIWLEKGELRADGDTASVTASYMEYMTGSVDFVSYSEFSDTDALSCSNRFGSNPGAIKTAEIPEALVTNSQSEFGFLIDIPKEARTDTLALSVSFKNNLGLDVSVISTDKYGIYFSRCGLCMVKIRFCPLLCRGEYSICVSLEDTGSNPIKYYDYADGIKTISVFSEKEYFGVFHTPASITITYGDDNNE